MNLTIFWILFISLWGVVPLMVIKGRKDTPKLQTTKSVKKEKRKGWFN